MLYASRDYESRESNPLEALVMVDVFLANPALPQFEGRRDFAIKHIISALITSQLSELRYKLGVETTDIEEKRPEALQSIRKDSAQQNLELLSWSWLYYRYVRVDLNISPDDFSKAAHTHTRTLRRYQNHSIRRLTERLITIEWETRIQQKLIRLCTKLPSTSSVRLYGRDEAFDIADRILNGDPPYHIQVTGVAGIGKTVFVQELLRRCIISGLLDDLVWIESPPSAQYARQYLHDTLLSDIEDVDLRTYTLFHRVAVVLDGADDLNQNALAELLNELSSAYVFVVCQIYRPTSTRIHHIVLSELERDAGIEFIQSLSAARGEITEPYANYVWQSLGGNPLVLTLALHNSHLKIQGFLDLRILDILFEETFHSLPESLKRIWIALAMFPPGGCDVHQLRQIFDGVISTGDINQLARHHLVEVDPETGRCRLITGARRFAEHLFQQPDPLVDSILAVLDKTLESEYQLVHDPLAHVLLTKWPKIDPDTEARWVRKLMPYGMSGGHYTTWTTILEDFVQRQPDYDADVHLALARCFRYLTEWPRAESILKETIRICGLKGQFAKQARALAELGIILRQQGSYAHALRALNKAKKVAQKYHDQELLIDLTLELAQIAIDSEDFSAFDEITEGLSETPRLLSLQSLACSARHDFDTSVGLIERILALQTTTPISRARSYAELGRILGKKGELARSHIYLVRALTILEQERDVYALARTQSNLGGVLISLGNYDEALGLLKQAEKSQLALMDRVALAVTRHNLIVLQQAMTIDRQ